MFKKAGIVVGITFILIACSLYWWVGNMDKPKVEGVETPSTTVVQNNPEPPKVETPQPVVQQPEIPASTAPTVVEPLPSVEQKQVFSVLDESDLGEPVIKRTEIMVIAKKKVVLLDSNFGQNDGKQLTYAVDLLYDEGTLTLYVNGVTYNSLKVGDKLKVDYQVFKNEKGVAFPTIVSADIAL